MGCFVPQFPFWTLGVMTADFFSSCSILECAGCQVPVMSPVCVLHGAEFLRLALSILT